jgi:hypothetical protein
MRMAEQTPTWGYRRIQGALANLRHTIDKQTMRNILRRYHQEFAPQRRKDGMSWAQFLKLHWDVLAATDCFTVEVATWHGLVLCDKSSYRWRKGPRFAKAADDHVLHTKSSYDPPAWSMGESYHRMHVVCVSCGIAEGSIRDTGRRKVHDDWAALVYRIDSGVLGVNLDHRHTVPSLPPSNGVHRWSPRAFSSWRKATVDQRIEIDEEIIGLTRTQRACVIDIPWALY